jgi:uncharacterized membrane protein YgdD (TMEM256/DUF423 family)
MKQIVLIFGAVYGGLSVIMGAFGAHTLKKVLSVEKLQSLETGVRYQMYHAIVLLVVGFFFSYSSKVEQLMGWSFIVGTFFFSVSIFLLTLAVLWEVNLRFLWPLTPLGGLIIILGWFLLLLSIVRMGKVYI